VRGLPATIVCARVFLPDARAEVGRMIEMVEAACAVPTTMQGRIIEDVARNVDAETVC